MDYSNKAHDVKKRTNVTLNSKVLSEAKALGVNLSQSAENGILEAIKIRKQALWLKENASAIESSNEYVETHGLPLAQYRNF